MRRQFNWLVVAVTGLVVVAFVIPLALLVDRQAREAAQVQAEQRAQTAAGALAVAVSSSGGQVSTSIVEGALVSQVEVLLPDGTRVGDVGADGRVVESTIDGRPASGMAADGSWTVAIPIATPEGILAVAAVATADEMDRGVWNAIAWLVGLALALMVGSVIFADRLGRGMVEPVTELAQVADRLANGDLAARASEDGPSEVRRVAAALNGLADRLESIIEGEREALADLSHRLRTPLTALRLQAERSSDPEALLEQVERTQKAVDDLIRDVRNRGQSQPTRPTDVVTVVGARMRFWEVLARSQERPLALELHSEALQVEADEGEVTSVVDALVGNVFAHTPPGTALRVAVYRSGDVPVLEVSDAGPGIPSSTAVDRGRSGAGSTGLGLDIARSFASRLGGKMQIDEGPEGGALIRLWLGSSG